ncbi:Rad17-domain-containing protein [Basidiobolus meristosporus CBS 931.73]|uniref:Rad17-domain-containing protein n=1 Tax=Basidiobolus meristosporus CBS 931.73 TaxID=1314790 RepID=A0A1Y1Y5C1_9FUNG|nr:Rad17-domain-containing protein [Basidiobolus meristosporus CBS 931.73]|eukprot:ORX92916.1 Rad17-domain-containing protein [Basidiobolus meristosporus CBS 931.73]
MLPTKRKAREKKEADLEFSCSQPVPQANKIIDLTESTYDDFDLVYSSRKPSISSRPKRKATYKPISKPKWKIPTSDKQIKTTSKNKIHSSIPLWEKYQPRSEEDIAVSKKKVSQVKSWVNSALDPATSQLVRNRMLVLTGPPGAGKTAVVKLLSEDVCFEIIEWINPIWFSQGDVHVDGTFDATIHLISIVHNSITSVESSRAIEAFEEFLVRSNKYPALSLQEETPSTSHNESQRKMVVIEDIPLLTSSTTKQHFHRALEKYILSPRFHYPLILIISDTYTRSDADSYKGRYLQDFTSVSTIIPASILASPFVQRISFNPIAPTFLKKALKQIVDLEYSQSQQQLTAKDVEAIVAQSNGDIRNALNGLQFLCLGDHIPEAIGPLVKNSKGKAKFDKSKDPNSVPLFSKESNLNLFHAIGKILYNKRVDHSAGLGSKQTKRWALPEHLKRHARLEQESNPDIVLEQVPVDPDVFTSFLHQNYLSFYSDIDECVNASEYMSSADYLIGSTNWTLMRKSRQQSGPTLNRYAAMMTTRGLMFSSTTAARFKPFYKPELWAVNRCAREFQENMASLQMLMQRSDLKDERALELEIGPYLSRMLQQSALTSAAHPIIDKLNRETLGFLYQLSTFTKPSQSVYTEGSRLEDDPFSMDVLEESKEKFIREIKKVVPLGPPPAPAIRKPNISNNYGPISDDDIEDFD